MVVIRITSVTDDFHFQHIIAMKPPTITVWTTHYNEDITNHIILPEQNVTSGRFGKKLQITHAVWHIKVVTFYVNISNAF